MSSLSLLASLSPDRPFIIDEDSAVETVFTSQPFGVVLAGEFVAVDDLESCTEHGEFACRSAACRPPTSGGTGGSRPGGARGMSQESLSILFPGYGGERKKENADGTFSVEGLDRHGNPIKFKDSTEEKLKDQWNDIGITEKQMVRNLVAGGRMAAGIDPKNPAAGPSSKQIADEAIEKSKWYTTANADCRNISTESGHTLSQVVAAATTLSAGRLWSGTKNGNIETARALAMLNKNPVELEITQGDIDMMNWRMAKSEKGVGRLGLDTSQFTPGMKISTKDLDAATLIEVLYAKNTIRGHSSFSDWMEKTQGGKKQSKEQRTTESPYPFFTSKGTQQVKQAMAILREEISPRQAISGPKYSSFYSNIINPNANYSSTNDTWHYRIMAGVVPLTHSKPKSGDTRTGALMELSGGGKGAFASAQDIFQSGVASKSEGLESGDGMFRDVTVITRKALGVLAETHPDVFGNMKLHEFQALIWVHYGGGQSSMSERDRLLNTSLNKLQEMTDEDSFPPN